jgi:hypothetical protein
MLPTDYPRLKCVASFEELIGTPFADGVNAMCWPRELRGDYAEVVAQIAAHPTITTLDESSLHQLRVSAAGAVAIDVLIEDQRRLEAHGLAPLLDCIHGYPEEDAPGPVRTDVYSFHVDSATIEADTWLCTYHGPSSEGLRHEEATRRVDDPATRAALLAAYGGADDAGFVEFLSDHCYDLHYAPITGAVPFVFGQGNLWRIACAYPGAPVPPCIHRAPRNPTGQPPRLLLIS